VNGAAARLVSPGDLIIIASFVQIEESACRALKPTVVFVDAHNQISEMRPEVAVDVDAL
jgi:aspartate 1-decarboxylase